MKNFQKNISITPLSPSNLKRAQELFERTFHDLDDYERKSLLASLYPAKHRKTLLKLDVASLRYWTLQIEKSVVGLCGLYEEIGDKSDTCWLGWFCIDQAYRGSGYGTRLLDFVINEAMVSSKEYLSLYTYDSKEHQAALRLYERFRFKAFRPNRVTRKGEIYLKRALGYGSIVKKKDNV